jgi:two-component system response regulator NreC
MVTDMVQRIRVHITDDHGVFRSGVRALLEREADMEVVSEAADSDSTLTQVAVHQPDVVLLDVSIPGKGAIKVARELLEARPALAIVVLTFHDEEHYLKEFMRLGARSFVLKTSSGTELIEAIRKAVRGEEHVDPSMAKYLVANYIGRPRRNDDPLGTLTMREREICGHLAAGRTNAEIAETLNISRRTVETHRAAIVAKLGFRSRAELVQFAVEHGLWKMG